MSTKTPPRDELRMRLTPEQFDVVCNEGTEPPFHNAYWDNHEPGIYVDVVSGEPLFSSLDKFDSGTGWPSFTRPLDPTAVVTRSDRRLLMERTEVRSKLGDAHLGHVFPDGPGPTGMRYCINSASLRFIPVARLEAEGYGRFLPLFGAAASGTASAARGSSPANAGTGGSAASSGNGSATHDGPAPGNGSGTTAAHREVATLAGGCFWGMEEILRNVPGVLETRVGYTGGTVRNPSYEQVCTGETGHAEAIEVVFDPSQVSYETLLEKYFFRMHDPTTPNRQGHDIGSQYRSAVFFHSADQRRTAEAVKARIEKSGRWKRPVVTEIVAAGPFYAAEGYHQEYLQKHPGGYSCHYLRE